MPLVLIVDLTGPENLREKNNRQNLRPRRLDVPVRFERLVTLLADDHIVVAIPQEIGRHRAPAYLLIVKENECMRWIGGDRDRPPHAACRQSNSEQRERQ